MFLIFLFIDLVNWYQSEKVEVKKMKKKETVRLRGYKN